MKSRPARADLKRSLQSKRSNSLLKKHVFDGGATTNEYPHLKLEIIRLVEGSHLSASDVGQLGIPRTTFCRWYVDIFSVAKLAWDQSPNQNVWNRILMRSGGVNQVGLEGDRTIAARVGGDVHRQGKLLCKGFNVSGCKRMT
jgi:hypothetical protein